MGSGRRDRQVGRGDRGRDPRQALRQGAKSLTTVAPRAGDALPKVAGESIAFSKLHGLGNDFLVVPAPRTTGDPGAVALRMCDRHRGVGADGILFFETIEGDASAHARARIFNADGSEAEMSGNGIRCLAAHLLREGLVEGDTVRLRTVSGTKVLVLRGADGARYTFESSMGTARLDPRGLPSTIDVPAPVVRFPLDVGSERVGVTLSSIGNPHCSTFWPSVDRAPVDRLGPLLERHAAFPNRTNVEFIEVVDRHRIRVRFWERGVGRTLASGTGSCAAATAALLDGAVVSPVTIETELGELLVRRDPSGEIFLTGPAEFVCAGVYLLPEGTG